MPPAIQVIAFEQPGIQGFLHRPEPADGRGLVLTHGAGGNCRAPLLIAAADAFALHGVTVLRCDLPFRQRRPSGPPSPSGAAADRTGLRTAVAALRDIAAAGTYLGGVSYGGRQASMLAAEEPAIAEALLLFSYPLHPPGRPAQLRTAHFPRLSLPVLFVQGSADPFGSLAELREAVTLIPGQVGVIPVDGAGHDLRRGRFDLAPVVKSLLTPAPR
jgi:predicted alpha/beta-hydrolase family hydrolase